MGLGNHKAILRDVQECPAVVNPLPNVRRRPLLPGLPDDVFQTRFNECPVLGEVLRAYGYQDSGPTVTPFTLTNKPAVVVHTSPLTGAVGATP